MGAINPHNRSVSDSEFDVLPLEERWDATQFKDLHGICYERATRYRKLRNIIGGTALAIAAGLGVARLTDTYELPSDAGMPMAIAEGLAIGVAGNYGRRSREERGMAARNAEIVAGMFTREQLEPPVWTQAEQ